MYFIRSGKTYTMQGPDDSIQAVSVNQSPGMGIVGRTIARIFDKMEDFRLTGWEFTATLEMIEIYNETLRDLLAPRGVYSVYLFCDGCMVLWAEL